MTTRLVSVFLLLLFLFSLFSASNVTLESESAAALSHSSASVSAYENVTTHEGDLIIDGTNAFVIENCTYVQKGNIFVKDYGSLFLRNSTFELQQVWSFEYRFYVEDHALLAIEDSRTMSEWGFGIYLLGYSRLIINNSNLPTSAIEGWEHAVIIVSNSTMNEAGVREYARLDVTGCWFGWTVNLFVGKNQNITLKELRPGYTSYWNLHDNQTTQNVYYNVTLSDTYVPTYSVWFDQDAIALVSDCEIARIGLSFSASTVLLEGARPTFYADWKMRRIVFRNTSVSSQWAVHFSNAGGTIRDSEINLGIVGIGDFLVKSSNITISTYDFSGEIFLHQSNLLITPAEFRFSNFQIVGDSRISAPRQWEDVLWSSSVVSRKYGVVVTDAYGKPVEGSILALTTVKGEYVWEGLTDLQGISSFNLTFNDSNHQDSWILSASKDELNSSARVGFLSDAPVEIVLDNMPPSISMSQPSNGSKVFGTLQIKGTANDNAELKLWKARIDNSLFMNTSLSSKSYSYSTSLNTRTLVNGTHILNVTVYDSSGNMNSTSVIVDVQNILEDFDGSGTVNIVDVTFVAVAYGSKPGDSNWNSEADLDNNGEVNIVDIAMVAKVFGKTVGD